ncbi:hypothetical protein OG21DRAFT_1518204 [Imleria badia]|nr:hypothetical protein OG21DRAFT_1518204 [Imleria badia]
MYFVKTIFVLAAVAAVVSATVCCFITRASRTVANRHLLHSFRTNLNAIIMNHIVIANRENSFATRAVSA